MATLRDLRGDIKEMRNEVAADRGGWLGGVCAAIGNSLKVEPMFVRIAVVAVGVFFTKTVIAAYLIGWMLLYRRRQRLVEHGRDSERTASAS